LFTNSNLLQRSLLHILPIRLAEADRDHYDKACGSTCHKRKDLKIILAQLFAFSIWSIPLYYIPKDNMGPKSLIPMILTLTFFYGIHYSAQFLFKLKNGYRYSWVIKLIGPIACFCLNYFRDGANQDTLYGLFSMVNYDLLFMAQGAIDAIYVQEIEKVNEELSHTVMMPFTYWLYGLNHAWTAPTIYHNEGFLFFYPLY